LVAIYLATFEMYSKIRPWTTRQVFWFRK